MKATMYMRSTKKRRKSSGGYTESSSLGTLSRRSRNGYRQMESKLSSAGKAGGTMSSRASSRMRNIQAMRYSARRSNRTCSQSTDRKTTARKRRSTMSKDHTQQSLKKGCSIWHSKRCSEEEMQMTIRSVAAGTAAAIHSAGCSYAASADPSYAGRYEQWAVESGRHHGAAAIG